MFKRHLYTLLFLFFASGVFASSTHIQQADSLISADTTKTYALPTASDTLAGLVAAQTLTNKTIVGVGTNTLSKIPIAAQTIIVTPTGTINGSNTSFTVATAPALNTAVQLYLDGLLLIYTTDFTISGSTITMVTAPATGQSLRAVYSQY